jgi:hypothetical protein
MRVFNFKELVPNGHVTVTEDGMLYAVELVMVVNGCNRVAANHTLSRIKEEHFSCSKLSIKRMPGKGNGHCKLVTFENAIELLMALPGEGAKEYRSKFAEVIKRYLAGDKTLVEEINANAESNAPIHKMARDACASDAAEDNSDGIVGQKRLHAALAMSRELVTNYKAANEYMREQNILARERGDIDKGIMLERGEIDIDFLRKRHEYEQNMLRARHDLEQTNRMSELEHAKAILEIERAKAALSQPQQVQPQASLVPAGHTTILKVYHKNKAAFDMLKASQIRGLLQSAGIKAKAAFEALHGTTPMRIKEGQYDVLCYPDSDEPLILEAIRSAMRDLLGHARPITSFVVFNSTTT